MSAIIEPGKATWWVSDPWAANGRISLHANREDRNLTIVRRYPPTDPNLGEEQLVESVELTMNQLADLEAAILNARLWLERATKQADELKAAEEIATDAAEDGPEALVCFCGHPFHGLKYCADCGCPRPPIPLGGS